jgi:hypothetical protein
VAIAFVQHASNTASVTSGTSSTLAATFSASTIAGNCLFATITIATANGTSAATISSVTSNGAAEHWASEVSAVQNPGLGGATTTAIWADPNTTGGQTIVDVTVTLPTAPTGTAEAAFMVNTFEFSGVAGSGILDKSDSATSSGSNAWSSGTTATTTQASEVWIGAATANLSSSFTMTPPATLWTNETLLSTSWGNAGTAKQAAGYQIVSSTGTAVYAGSTSSVSTIWSAAVATFKGGAVSAVSLPNAGGMLRPVTVIPYRAGWASAGHSR